MIKYLKQTLVRLGPRNPITRAALRFGAHRNGCRLEFGECAIHLIKGANRYIIAEKDFTYIPMLFLDAEKYFEPVLPDNSNCWDYSVPAWHTYAKTGLQFYLPSFPEEDDGTTYTRRCPLQPGDVVWDVGAHAGVSASYFSKLVGEAGKVLAWEPDNTNYRCLLKNIEHHGLSNVVPIKKALAGSTGKMQFQSEGTMGSTFSQFAAYLASDQTTQVETVSLEDACREFGTPRFIKMDIEGAEKQVILQALDFLEKSDIEWSIEANHLVDNRLTYLDMEELFPKCGYEVISEKINGYFFCWASPRR